MAKDKKKTKKEKVGRVKAVGRGLEGFVDWGERTASGPAKEKEGNMSSLAAGFVALRMLIARLPSALKVQVINAQDCLV